MCGYQESTIHYTQHPPQPYRPKLQMLDGTPIYMVYQEGYIAFKRKHFCRITNRINIYEPNAFANISLNVIRVHVWRVAMHNAIRLSAHSNSTEISRNSKAIRTESIKHRSTKHTTQHTHQMSEIKETKRKTHYRQVLVYKDALLSRQSSSRRGWDTCGFNICFMLA